MAGVGIFYGYQRAFFFYLLSQYLTPHKLQLAIAYEIIILVQVKHQLFHQRIIVQLLLRHSELPTPFGGPLPYGSPSNIENSAAVFLAKQRCMYFQITLNEIYDSSLEVPAGAGLTLSGLNLVIGAKKD